MIHLIAIIFFYAKSDAAEVVKVVSLDSIKSMSKECFKDVRPVKRYIVKIDELKSEDKSKKHFQEERYFKILNNGEEKLIARKIVSSDSSEVKEVEVCSKYWTK